MTSIANTLVYNGARAAAHANSPAIMVNSTAYNQNLGACYPIGSGEAYELRVIVTDANNQSVTSNSGFIQFSGY